MEEETSSSLELPMEKRLLEVHLFNCDRTYKFDAVENLLRNVEGNTEYKFSVEKHYFPLPKMAETCAELATYQMDFAVFVVHANESRLSLNEEGAGIGYARIYRSLLHATGDRVLIVIGGDEKYEHERDTQVLSRWAKMKIFSQFSTEFLDGRKSFVFSWGKKHHLIHEEAMLHFLNLENQGKRFVPVIRPIVQTSPEPNTTVIGSEGAQNEDNGPFAQRTGASVSENIHQSSFDDAQTPTSGTSIEYHGSFDKHDTRPLEEYHSIPNSATVTGLQTDTSHLSNEPQSSAAEGTDIGKEYFSGIPASQKCVLSTGSSEQAEKKRIENGNTLRMIVHMVEGEIKIMQKLPNNWIPPKELMDVLKKRYAGNRFTEKIEIWEDRDGNHIIRPKERFWTNTRKLLSNLNCVCLK